MQLVSVIIPAYNAEKYIDETIASVVAQTYKNWELIVVNDGSADNTPHKVDEWAKKDERISVIHKQNSGVSDSRNKGLEVAKGEYISFLDADDVWLPTNLEEKINVLCQENADFVYSDVHLIDENSKVIGDKKGDDNNILKDYLLWNKTVIPAPCSNILMNRYCFENNLCFDAQFSTAADQDFCLHLSANYKGKRIPKELWSYRILPNSMSRNIVVMEKDHIGVYEKAAKEGLFHSFWFKQRCFSNLYLILAGSWWVNGNNKLRGMYFMLRSVIAYPPNCWKLIKKLLPKQGTE